MRTAITLTHITLLSFATLTGCLSHTRDDADAGRDAAFVPSDVCACVDGPRNICEPMSAAGVGGCEAELGYRWDGSTCRSISGCSCEGTDCAQLAPSEAVCLEQHRSCRRPCGASFGGTFPACLSGEYCDHPGCGADDGLGVCNTIPDSCAPGAFVCGCDGTTYAHLCEAAAAGVSVARLSACAVPLRFAQMRATCAPTDGPAWAFTLTSSSFACEPAPSGERLEFEIWTELNTAPAEVPYVLGAPGGVGIARFCPSSGALCVEATGSVTVHGFAAGEVTRFDYDLTTTDGRRLVETSVEGTNWCRVVGPGCG